MNYLFDTNAIIYLLKGETKTLPINENDNILISFITKIELLCHETSPDETLKIKEILKLCDIIFIDDVLIDSTINIRKTKKFKLPDSVIVATALQNSAILITADNDIIKIASQINIEIFNPLK